MGDRAAGGETSHTMTTKPITVTSKKDGRKEKAELLTCAKCGGDIFLLIVIKGHQHVQCYLCDEMFCDGTCGGKDYGADHDSINKTH